MDKQLSETQELVISIGNIIEQANTMRASDYKDYGRELSLVITKLEEAQMWLNRIDSQQMAVD
jgi:hypothetical protein